MNSKMVKIHRITSGMFVGTWHTTKAAAQAEAKDCGWKPSRCQTDSLNIEVSAKNIVNLLNQI